MEKQSKNKISKFLSKAISFQNPSFSPAGRRDNVANTNNLRSNANRGFSGPIVSMIPAEARGRRSKNANLGEPTSPKVSCMGQIKIKHRKNKIGKKERVSQPAADVAAAPPEKKPLGGRWKIFNSRKASEGRKLDGLFDDQKNLAPDPSSVPSLNQMKKFSSSRETFANFDWTTAQIAPAERGLYSDGEGEDEVIIPFSAPILLGGRGGGGGGSSAGGGGREALQPRKEINIWKRRTMTQPKPLQLD